ncbi:PAS domain S-box-containing protein [Mariprofundus aestuarium]|uniref:PAS domain S-box-containing protein n=1 Tax=Mariprofundus aestuarium TaxID=1921086 RepID=A0A2K8L009_MARES|nr:PAS domain S-box protein [Mariprofundus aestuarium]ATX79519.1 PAS domain S-box-containing protein [Mariprofundus aestuarium]
MSAESSSDPFIVKHLTNRVAAFLKQQQILFPGMYGEIFLTNRFGVMVASTGKLTTLAHADKYWWKAAFDKGDGKIFFDDRGFDTSVGGYVLGVVVPIYQGGEIIGLMKANINILGPIRTLIDSIKLKHEISAKLVRSNGLIVYEKGVEPLSAKVDQSFIGCVGSHVTVSLIDSGSGAIVACTPVAVTIESESSGFGGKGQSVDQLKGNIDETWSVLLSEEADIALAAAHETAKALIVVGLLIVFFSALLAWILGRIAARPLVILSDVAKAIGEGALETRAPEGAADEIGKLAGSVNKMAINLQETMASRDELKHEIELRKKAEESLRLLSSSVEQAREAISITDRHGIIEYVNRAFTLVTGYGAEEIIGKNHNILSSGTHDAHFYRHMWETISSGRAWQGRIVDRKKDGSLYPAMMTVSPIADETGETTHFVGIQQSLKEHEEMESQLRHAQKMEALGTLIGGIAHDFKITGHNSQAVFTKLSRLAFC